MAFPAFDVVQPDAINFQEVAGWRIFLSRFICKMLIYERASYQTGDRRSGARRYRVRFCVIEEC